MFYSEKFSFYGSNKKVEERQRNSVTSVPAFPFQEFRGRVGSLLVWPGHCYAPCLQCLERTSVCQEVEKMFKKDL